ncbi:ABC transporter permease [Pelagibius litoralis]|uniref:ABC transporter permease n=2 Tax=Pelagibius litoralis TaxID=374515 RepID=A0A967EXT0_9PROT|nr:ABC transporter permease [Pelagibius litoralis]
MLLLPASFLVGLLTVCGLAVLRMSFGRKNAEWSDWSFDSYVALADPYFVNILADTLWLALLSAVITSVISFPVALFMARTRSEVARRMVLICIMLPMLVSLLVQSFGWVAILGPDGLANQIVGAILDVERPLALLFNRTGVLLGLIQTTVPLAVLPMVASLKAIPLSLEEAASVLGASRAKVYTNVILPLAWPGIAAGLVLVFGFNTGAFVVPLLLGGLKVTTLALVIRDQMGVLLNWPMGSALSVILIAFALTVQALQNVIGRRVSTEENSHG